MDGPKERRLNTSKLLIRINRFKNCVLNCASYSTFEVRLMIHLCWTTLLSLQPNSAPSIVLQMSERFRLNTPVHLSLPPHPQQIEETGGPYRQPIRGGGNTQEEYDNEARIIFTDHHFEVQLHCATTLRPFKIRSSACTHGSEVRHVRRQHEFGYLPR